MKVTTQAVIRSRLKTKLKALGYIPSQEAKNPELQRLLLNRVQSRFRRMVAPDGTPWAARVDGSRNNLLMSKKATLYKSIGVVATSAYYVNTGAGFRITADAESESDGYLYGLAHQRGTVNMVARVFLGVSLLDVRALTRKYKLLVDRRLERL